MSLSGQEAVKRMGEMDPAQRRAHFWITLTVDTLYPIAYGCFFAGATYKFSGSKKSWVALPAVVTMLADFCENISQIIALSGVENVLTAKTIFSPIKFTSYIVMTVLFLGIALLALIRYVKRGRA